MRRPPRPRAIASAAAAALLLAAPAAEAGPRPLPLADAIALALAQNRALAGAEERAEGAVLDLGAARAEYELRVAPAARLGASGGSDAAEESAGLGVTLSRRTPGGGRVEAAPAVSRADGTHRAEIAASFLQPLLRGRGGEPGRALLDAGEYAARAARRALHARRVETVLETVTAAYAAVRGRELLRLTEESAARLRGHAEAARIKEKMGLAGPIDTYRAAIQLQAAEDALAVAREEHRDALDTLKVVLALPLDEEIAPEAPLAWDAPDVGEEEAVRAALAGRVELEQAADTLAEAGRRARLAANAVLPEVNLLLTYRRFGEGPQLADAADLDRDAWGATLTSATTLDRAGERAAHARSLLDVAAARRGLALLRDEVAREVRREHRGLRRARARIAIQEEQIRQARGQLELARVKFRHGLADNFAVLEAEIELRRAETSLLEAGVAQIVGSWRLRAAMGTLLERPGAF